jgi:hypothetical protein
MSTRQNKPVDTEHYQAAYGTIVHDAAEIVKFMDMFGTKKIQSPTEISLVVWALFEHVRKQQQRADLWGQVWR